MNDAVWVWLMCGVVGLLSACHRVPNVVVVLSSPHLVPKVWTELVVRALVGGPVVLLLEVATRLKIPTTRGRVVSVFLGMLVGLTGGYTACG